jgi:heme exporter protein D
MRFEKLAALGALGATGGLLLAYALFVWLALPQPATGGIDRAHASVVWIAIGLVILALVALHLALAHQLWHAPAPRDTRRRR